jgi:hypothetical protein
MRAGETVQKCGGATRSCTCAGTEARQCRGDAGASERAVLSFQ